jgi:hypothetical protein
MINFYWITSKSKLAGFFIFLILIANQTFSQSLEKNHLGYGSMSSELENGIDAPTNVNLNYQLELFPGQVFKGNYYYWSSGGTKTANFQFINSVLWLSITPSSFTSSSCSDIVRVEFNFVAPQAPGIYNAAIQDLNSNWDNTNITLSVTENPTSAFIQSYQVNLGQTVSKLDTLYWNGFGNFSCLNNYVPGSTRLYSFAEKDSVSWFNIAPSNLTLPLSGVGTIESTISGITAGSDHVYIIEEAEYASLCFFFRVNVNVITDVEETYITDIPLDYSLKQNYPNPFNPSTVISWQLPVGSHQTLKIYDVLGNEAATLVDEFREAGRYETTFDASTLSSGIYFYRLQAGSFVETKKMLLLK